MVTQKFCDYLEKRRRELKLTKKEFAIRAGITPQGLRKIINRDVKEIKQSTILSLAKSAQVHPISLLRLLSIPIKNQESKYQNDYSGFDDETIPDNSIMTVDYKFTKTWTLVNLGRDIWENRCLVCCDDQVSVMGKTENNVSFSGVFLIPSERKVMIPVTKPEEKVTISVRFRTPSLPCTVYSYWKMFDENGELCFPKISGVYCCVKVVGF